MMILADGVQIPEDVWGALIAVLGAVTLWIAADARRQSKQASVSASAANRAVNGVDGGSRRLYDLVAEMHIDFAEFSAWMRSYQGGPLDTGPKVIQFVRKVEEELDAIRAIRQEMHHCKLRLDQLAEHGCARRCGAEHDDPNE